jgi:hypothetical protein
MLGLLRPRLARAAAPLLAGGGRMGGAGALRCLGTAANAEYLSANAAADGVTVTTTGLQYRVLKSGAPDAPSPRAGDPCSCHYEGRLLDGAIFDSSYARGAPTTFAPNQARAAAPPWPRPRAPAPDPIAVAWP